MSCCQSFPRCRCAHNCRPNPANPCQSISFETVKGGVNLLRAITAQVPPATGQQHTLSLPPGRSGLALTIIRTSRTDVLYIEEADLCSDVAEVIQKLMTLLPAP